MIPEEWIKEIEGCEDKKKKKDEVAIEEFLIKYHKTKTYSDIGRVLGLGETTVRTRLKKLKIEGKI